MSGSGGGFFSSSADPDALRERAREAEERALDDDFAVQVDGYLSSELAQYNERDTDGLSALFDEIVDVLGDDVEGRVDMLFGGSIAKHTYVDGLSDIDALVLFKESDVAQQSPDELRNLLGRRLAERYGTDAVHVGQLAVTLDVGGMSVQLLPAIRQGDGFKISSVDGNSWAQIRPRTFAGLLTRTNQRMSGKLIPTVKLAKAVLAQLPEQRRLSGYHVESLGLKVFREYDGPKTPKAMLVHFFEKAAVDVRTPITDSTGQSVHVDDYLGPAESLQRRVIADSLSRIARRMRNADGARSVELWRELFR